MNVPSPKATYAKTETRTGDKKTSGRSDRFKGLAQHLAPDVADNRLLATDLSSSMGFLLRVASGVAQDKLARRIDSFGLRQTLFTLLVVIEDNPGLKQQEIGQILSIQQPNLVALINELCELGLVSRVPNVTDRRSYSLSLTEQGLATVAKARALHADNERQIAEAIAPMSIADFRDALRKVINLSMSE